MYQCRNLCERIAFKETYHVKKNIGPKPKSTNETMNIEIKHQRQYSNGFKRCNECTIFLQHDGISCPCCNKLLMVSKHNLVKHRELKERKIKLPHSLPKDIILNKDKWEALINPTSAIV
jgi:hypothetical protein